MSIDLVESVGAAVRLRLQAFREAGAAVHQLCPSSVLDWPDIKMLLLCVGS
jgi:hypothetical protein